MHGLTLLSPSIAGRQYPKAIPTFELNEGE